MKPLVVLTGCAVFLLGVGGCQTDKGVTVVVDGGGRFPKTLAGRWKDQKRGWEFVFEKDGTISSAVIGLGRAKLNPKKKVQTIPLRKGGKATFELGQWTGQYTPNTRELAVEVVLENFHFDMLTQGLKGHSTDWLVGPVSQDSQSWEADWFTFTEFVSVEPDEKVYPVDPNSNPIDILTFRKQP